MIANILRSRWFYLPFLVSAILLILTRRPWIDEAWFAGRAIALMRHSEILELSLCVWRPDVPRVFLSEAYALLQSIWYLVGIDVIWGRLLSALGGLLSLFLFNYCLISLELSRQVRAIVIVILSINYYFLWTASQIRPEIFAVLFAALGLASLIRWQCNCFAQPHLLLIAHLSVIISVFFHLQAAFILVSLVIYHLVYDRNKVTLTNVIHALIPYVVLGGAYIFYIILSWDDFYTSMQAIFSGNMLGHSGGMLTAARRYLNGDEYLKLFSVFITTLLLASGIILFWYKNQSPYGRVIVFFALGGYVSWLLTTAHLDDYHAIWLIFSLLAATVASIQIIATHPAPSGTMVRVGRITAASSVLAFVIAQSVFGVYSALRSLLDAPFQRHNAELMHFEQAYSLREHGLSGVRDIMWHFDFDEEILCQADRRSPNYFIHHNEKREEICLYGFNYNLVDNQLFYSLYKIDPGVHCK